MFCFFAFCHGFYCYMLINHWTCYYRNTLHRGMPESTWLHGSLVPLGPDKLRPCSPLRGCTWCLWWHNDVVDRVVLRLSDDCFFVLFTLHVESFKNLLADTFIAIRVKRWCDYRPFRSRRWYRRHWCDRCYWTCWYVWTKVLSTE